MATRCPCCNRVFRTKKPKQGESPDEAVKRIAAKIKTGINVNLRKPMPKGTPYKT